MIYAFVVHRNGIAVVWGESPANLNAHLGHFQEWEILQGEVLTSHCNRIAVDILNFHDLCCFLAISLTFLCR